MFRVDWSIELCICQSISTSDQDRLIGVSSVRQQAIHPRQELTLPNQRDALKSPHFYPMAPSEKDAGLHRKTNTAQGCPSIPQWASVRPKLPPSRKRCFKQVPI